MQDMYQDGTYASSNPTWHEEDAPWKARQIEGILADNRVAYQTVCEVGCGTGEILVRLAAGHPGVAYSGYDISPQAYARASRNERPGVTFHHGDALEEPDAHFDLVIIADVIEHVEDYLGFIRKVKAIGDRTVFHIPLDLSAQSVIRMSPIMGLRGSVGHIHYFTKDTALAALTDCGYKIVDWRYTASRLELPNQTRSSHIVAPLRKALHRAHPDLAVRILGGYSLLVLAE